MKYAVDRIENNIVVLESLEDQTKKEFSLAEFTFPVKEGNILLYENESYTLDIQEEQSRRETIKSKFDMLRKK